jgi:Domain of unknown function (DUF5658)
MTDETVAEPTTVSMGDLVLKQLRGLPAMASPGAPPERRMRVERRRLTLWSVIYGGFRPRRRQARRSAETALPIVDWHDAHLLAVAVTILLLCLIDAVLSVVFILGGGSELNPIMEKLIAFDVAVFAVAKIAMTGFGIGVLVLLAKLRLFGAIRVVQSLYGVLLIYVALVAYELLILSSYFTT